MTPLAVGSSVLKLDHSMGQQPAALPILSPRPSPPAPGLESRPSESAASLKSEG